MGATNCPETPRQKMIQMMYLVYTAMLALNVSAEILNAFVVVDDTVSASTRNATSQNASDYSWFEAQKSILGEAKIHDAYVNAQSLKKQTNDMVKFIEKMRRELIFAVDGDTLVDVKNEQGKMVKVPTTVGTIVHKDNFDIPSDFMINKGNAKKLKAEIKKYKENVLKLAKKEDREGLSKALGLDVDSKFKHDGVDQSWEEHNFDHIIAAAAVTLLNKEIGEVRNAEANMLAYLKASISADDFKFDQVSGRAIPKSHMVFTGDSYEADIIVAAYDTKSTPEVYYKMGADTLTEAGLAGANKLEGENGVVKLKIPAGGIGEQKYAGLIKIMDPNGQPKYYGFSDKYAVLQANSATIAADKMNVLYAGIANPISVSAPMDPSKLSVSFPGCSVAGAGAGKYNVTVPASMIGKTVTATVSGKSGDANRALGSSTFRVKKVPDPKSRLGSYHGGKRSKAELLANPMVIAKMDEGFVFDLQWTVQSFRVTFVIKGMEEPAMACQGGKLSDAVKAKIQKASSGTIIYITDIKASSPAGTRTLDEMSFRIK